MVQAAPDTVVSAAHLGRDSFTSAGSHPMKLGKIDIVRSDTMRSVEDPRAYLSRRYLFGRGIEVGALDHPTPLSRGSEVEYADRLTTNDLSLHYPEIERSKLAPVGLIGNCEYLDTLSDGRKDFVIANHFLEHCQNPLGTLLSFARTLKASGRILLTLPHRERTFDAQRSPSTQDHFLMDLADGGISTRYEHFYEWVTLVNRHLGSGAADEAVLLMRQGYSIHYHAWTTNEFLDFVRFASNALPIVFDVVACLENEAEFICVLQLQH